MKINNVVGRWIRLVLGLFWLAGSAGAWTTISEAVWPDGSVAISLRLGDTPAYSNGQSPNEAAEVAGVVWNKYMKRLGLVLTKDGLGAGVRGNGVNEVSFDFKIDGELFPSQVLAVTFNRRRGSELVESDIVVNTAITWESYSGSLKYSPVDIGRVLTHELGHTLGLGHPDVAGQNYSAIMNSHVSDLALPANDDIEGVANLYGVVPGFEPATPIIYGRSISADIEAGQLLHVSIGVGPGNTNYTYQWFKDGVLIPGATGMTHEVNPSSLSDAGAYYIEVKSAVGITRSRDYVVKVRPRVAPTVNIYSSAGSIYATQSMLFQSSCTGSAPLSFQWQRNGVNIAGATNSYYTLTNATVLDSGNYSLIVSNDVGSVSSKLLPFEVKEVPLPVFASSLAKTLELQEGVFSLFTARAGSVFPLQWQWSKDGVKLAITTESLTFAGLETDAGVYTYTATNSAGSVSGEVCVSIVRRKTQQAFDVYPLSGTFQLGANLTLIVTVSNPGLYQWYKDGALLAGQSSTSLEISSLKLADAGDYWVVVTVGGVRYTSTASSIKVLPRLDASGAEPGRTAVHDGIFYYLQSSPAVVKRFDLASGTSLAPLPLAQEAVQLCVGSAGVFVATASAAILHCRPNESAFQPLYQATVKLRCMASTGDQLFWLDETQLNLQCLQVSTKTLLRASYFYNNLSYLVGMRASERNKSVYLFGDRRAAYQSCGFDVTGLGMASWSDNPVQGPRPYFTSDERSFFDSLGNLYDVAKLTKLGTVGLAPESLVFLKDGRLLVLSSGRIVSFSQTLTPSLSMEAPAGTVELVSSDTAAYALVIDAAKQVSVQALDLGKLSEVLAPSQSVQVTGIPGMPGLFEQDRSGLVWTVVRQQQILAAWSPEERRYVKAIKLRGLPNLITYSQENDSLYLYYPDRLLTVVELSKSPLSERCFAWASIDATGLSTQGRLLSLSYFGAVHVYDPQGKAVNITNYLGCSALSVWDAARRVVYCYNDDRYPTNLVSYTQSETGPISGYTSMPSDISLKAGCPIALGADTLLLGTGALYEVPSMRLLKILPAGHNDAVCVKGAWITVNDSLNGSLVTRWNVGASAVEKTALVLGRPKRIFAVTGDRLLLISERYGAPRYTLLDGNLSVLSTDTMAKPNRLANISVQADVGKGVNALVPGFVLGGTQPKTLLIRGCGPGLADFGVPSTLADPQITLFNGAGVAIASNDNWGSLSNQRELRERSADLYAFKLKENSGDAVLLVTLNPGPYTAEIKGVAEGTGRAIMEVYDADDAPGDSRAVNLSSRCVVSEKSAAVGGFVIHGDKPRKVLLRGIGPTLTRYQVSGVLPDPKLRLFRGSTVIAESNDWSSDEVKAAAIRAAFASTGAFVLDEKSKDAAILVELQPGDYTMWLESNDGSGGVGLIELYEVP